jgi:hypothetical protein
MEPEKAKIRMVQGQLAFPNDSCDSMVVISHMDYPSFSNRRFFHPTCSY